MVFYEFSSVCDPGLESDMSNEWQLNTNKKLHFARILLDAWEQSLSHDAQAFKDGFVSQLQMVWRSLLAEVLSSYGMNIQSAPDFPEALVLIQNHKAQASEFTQLQAMLEQGWLRELQKEWQLLFEPYKAAVGSSTSGMIQMVDLHDAAVTKLEMPETGKQWLLDLKNLVGHFRNFNLEW